MDIGQNTFFLDWLDTVIRLSTFGENISFTGFSITFTFDDIWDNFEKCSFYDAHLE